MCGRDTPIKSAHQRGARQRHVRKDAAGVAGKGLEIFCGFHSALLKSIQIEFKLKERKNIKQSSSVRR